MPSGTPWSVKGIDPRARVIAKTAARRDGLTLGEWLNKVILDDGEDMSGKDWGDRLSDFPGFGGGGGEGDGDADALRAVVARLADRLEAAEQRSTLALKGVDQSVLSLSRRLEMIEQERDEAGSETEEALARTRAAQDEVLDRIRRLERSGGPAGNGEAVKAVETTLGKLATRMYENEREVRAELDTLALKEERRRDATEKLSKSLTQRLEEAERKARDEFGALKDQIDTRETRNASTLETLGTATRSLQQRLTAAEGATHRAAEMLGASHEKLEARLRELETRSADGISQHDFQRRFDHLAVELAEVIRSTRNDFARQIESVAKAGGSADLQRAIESAEARIAAAEHRQSDQLARIGDAIGKLARAMDSRLDETDRRIETRLADAERQRRQGADQAAIESRLDQVRAENSTAVRRIGEEVAKLGSSLADRVQQAEERSARAMEAAGERMAQVVEKLDARRVRPEDDLQARIVASEERTARRIEEAMEKIHTRLEATRNETHDVLTPVQRAMNALAERLEAIEGRGAAKADASAEAKPAEPVAPVVSAPSAPVWPTPEIDFGGPLPVPPGVEALADSFDAAVEADSFVMDAELPIPPRRQRAQARAAEQSVPNQPVRSEAPRRPAVLGATADADFLAAARKSARGNRTSREDVNRYVAPEVEPESKRGRMVLIGASVLSFIVIGAAAALLLLDSLNGGAAPRTASAEPESLSELFADPLPVREDVLPTAGSVAGEGTGAETIAETPVEPIPAPQSVEPAPVRPVRSEPAAAGPAVSLQPVASPPTVTLEQAASNGDAVARYQLAVQLSESGNLSEAVTLMRRAAEQGVPAAQYRYARMLQRGEGVGVDEAAARSWMVRAAEGGNLRAMHNAGALFINAEALPENQERAAYWFQQAALHGVRDSQFNLALLFQSGYGVPESAADAYAWFLIAAAGGDSAASDRATALRRDLTVEQRSAAEDVANSFTPRSIDPVAQGDYPPQAWSQTASPSRSASADPALVIRAQQLLAGLGYDAGPADGDFGPQTRDAIVAYQSSRGLPATGAVDASLVASLEQAATR